MRLPTILLAVVLAASSILAAPSIAPKNAISPYRTNLASAEKSARCIVRFSNKIDALLTTLDIDSSLEDIHKYVDGKKGTLAARTIRPDVSRVSVEDTEKKHGVALRLDIIQHYTWSPIRSFVGQLETAISQIESFCASKKLACPEKELSKAKATQGNPPMSAWANGASGSGSGGTTNTPASSATSTPAHQRGMPPGSVWSARGGDKGRAPPTPYKLSPPESLLPLHLNEDSLGFPSFFPTTSASPELRLARDTIQKGYYYRSPFQNESLSAHTIMLDRIHDPSHAQRLDALLAHIHAHKSSVGPIQRPATFPPPERHQVSTIRRETWIADLASSSPPIPLHALAKAVPQGFLEDKLLDLLIERRLSLPRAAWTIRILGFCEISAVRCLSSRYAEAFTKHLGDHMYQQLAEFAGVGSNLPGGGSSSSSSAPSGAPSGTGPASGNAFRPWRTQANQERWASRWSYTLQLALWLHQDALLDQRVWYKWILDHFSSANLEQTALLLPLLRPILLSFIARSATLSRHLLRTLLDRLAGLHAYILQSPKAAPYIQLEASLHSLLHSLLLHLPDAFIQPRVWAQHSPIIRRVLAEKATRQPAAEEGEIAHPETTFADPSAPSPLFFLSLERRNYRLMGGTTDRDNGRGSAPTQASHLIESSLSSPESIIPSLSSRLSLAEPDAVYALLDWAISPHTSTPLPLAIIRTHQALLPLPPHDAQAYLLWYIERWARLYPTKDATYPALIRLLAHLSTHALFSPAALYQRLVSLGMYGLSIPSSKDPYLPWYLRFLNEFPVRLTPSDLRILSEAVSRTDHILPDIAAHTANGPSPILFPQFPHPPPVEGSLADLTRLIASAPSAAATRYTHHYLLPIVFAYIVRDVEISQDNWRIITVPGTCLIRSEHLATAIAILEAAHDSASIHKLCLWILTKTSGLSSLPFLPTLCDTVYRHLQAWSAQSLLPPLVEALTALHTALISRSQVDISLLRLLHTLGHPILPSPIIPIRAQLLQGSSDPLPIADISLASLHTMPPPDFAAHILRAEDPLGAMDALLDLLYPQDPSSADPSDFRDSLDRIIEVLLQVGLRHTIIHPGPPILADWVHRQLQDRSILLMSRPLVWRRLAASLVARDALPLPALVDAIGHRHLASLVRMSHKGDAAPIPTDRLHLLCAFVLQVMLDLLQLDPEISLSLPVQDQLGLSTRRALAFPDHHALAPVLTMLHWTVRLEASLPLSTPILPAVHRARAALTHAPWIRDICRAAPIPTYRVFEAELSAVAPGDAGLATMYARWMCEGLRALLFPSSDPSTTSPDTDHDPSPNPQSPLFGLGHLSRALLSYPTGDGPYGLHSPHATLPLVDALLSLDEVALAHAAEAAASIGILPEGGGPLPQAIMYILNTYLAATGPTSADRPRIISTLLSHLRLDLLHRLSAHTWDLLSPSPPTSPPAHLPPADVGSIRRICLLGSCILREIMRRGESEDRTKCLPVLDTIICHISYYASHIHVFDAAPDSLLKAHHQCLMQYANVMITLLPCLLEDHPSATERKPDFPPWILSLTHIIPSPLVHLYSDTSTDFTLLLDTLGLLLDEMPKEVRVTVLNDLRRLPPIPPARLRPLSRSAVRFQRLLPFEAALSAHRALPKAQHDLADPWMWIEDLVHATTSINHDPPYAHRVSPMNLALFGARITQSSRVPFIRTMEGAGSGLVYAAASHRQRPPKEIVYEEEILVDDDGDVEMGGGDGDSDGDGDGKVEGVVDTTMPIDEAKEDTPMPDAPVDPSVVEGKTEDEVIPIPVVPTPVEPAPVAPPVIPPPTVALLPPPPALEPAKDHAMEVDVVVTPVEASEEANKKVKEETMEDIKEDTKEDAAPPPEIQPDVEREKDDVPVTVDGGEEKVRPAVPESSKPPLIEEKGKAEDPGLPGDAKGKREKRYADVSIPGPPPASSHKRRSSRRLSEAAVVSAVANPIEEGRGKRRGPSVPLDEEVKVEVVEEAPEEVAPPKKRPTRTLRKR